MKSGYFALAILLASSIGARAECFGDYPYRVCTDTYTDSRGNTTVRSYDTMGNTYSADTRVRDLPGGGTEVRSSDSEGNSYSIRSWSDSSGAHTVDSEGNRCTITPTGRMIGCGQ
jgi:hypothetical protein